jgi:two-component system sensor histidine kinase UhpB
MELEFRVLLIEDYPAAAALTINELAHSPFGPFAITHVSRLADALASLENSPPFDAVLVDLGLPDSQGLTTLETLRKQTQQAIPIVVLTGLDDENTRLRALESGAEDYLGKDESPGSMRTRAIRHAIEHKRLHEEVTESQQRLAMAADATNLGIFDWDLRTGFIAGSFHLNQLFGFAPEEFDGTAQSIEQRVHPDDQAGRQQSIRQSIEARGEYQCEYRVIWSDSTEHWIASRGKVFSDTMGKASRMVGTVMDVTARKAVEKAAAIRSAAAERLSDAKLTARELTLLELVTAGLPNKKIALQLGISPRTVAKHRSHLMAKTKALNAADLARMTALARSLPH